MKLSRLIVTAQLLCLAFVANAQNVSTQELKSMYGNETIEQMVSNDPQALDLLKFTQMNGWYIQDMNGEKDISSFPDALAVTPKHEDTAPLTLAMIEEGFFIGDYQFPIEEKHYGYYRIGDSGVLFIVYPNELIKQLYDRSQSE